MAIKNYLARYAKDGFVRPNKFNMWINPPPVLQGAEGYTDLLAFSGYRVSWPSYGINMSDALIDGIHNRRLRDIEYDPFTVSFYCNELGSQYYFFDQWCKSVRDPSTRIPAYYDEYCSSGSRLTVLKNSSGVGMDDPVPHMDVRFNKLFPTKIIGNPMDWGEKNKLWTFDVIFNYDYAQDSADVGKSRNITGSAQRGEL